MHDMAPIDRLSTEIKKMGAELDRVQARSLVDLYYRWQEHRLALQGQIRAAVKGQDDDVDTSVLSFFAGQMESLERQMVKVLDRWSDEDPVASWAKSIVGIGPVIATGLSAYIDIEKAPTSGSVWRYAGLDPSVTWGKGEKRPWNAGLKVLCWKVGQSFVKQQSREGDFYGGLYRQRKQYEQEQNDKGAYAEQAAAVLKRSPRHAQAEVYRQGRLPKGHIDARARRWVVKLFLSHWHHVAWESTYGEVPPKPYAFSHLGHAHIVDPPNHLCIGQKGGSV